MKKYFSIIMICLLVAGTFPLRSAAAQREDGLVAYWSFDEVDGGVVKDLSGNGIDLTVSNPSYQIENGFYGNTLSFDAADTSFDAAATHMQCTTDKLTSLLNGSEAVTVTGYIKKYNSNAATSNIPAFKYQPGFGAIMIFPDKDTFSVQMRSSSSDTLSGITAKNVYYATKGIGNNPCGWMQFAIVFDYAQKTARIYNDGALVAEQDVPNFTKDVFTASGSGTLGIGTRYASLDEIKIYSKSFTDDEIRRSFPPAVEYDFEDTADGVLKNLTGNAAQGVINGDVTETSGVSGKTAYFSQSVSLPQSGIVSALTRARDVAASFWLKLPKDTSADNITFFAARASNKSVALEIKTVGGKLYVGARSADADKYSAVASASAVNKYDGAWHHCLVTINYASKTAQIYIDGVLDNEGTMANFTKDMLDCGILAYNQVGAEDSIGAPGVLLDSFKLYRRATDADEAAALARELPFAKADISHDGESVNAVVSVANQSGGLSVDNALVVFAKYDAAGQQLLDADIAYIPQLENGGRTEITLRLDGIDNPDDYKFDVLTWDGLTTMASLADNYMN